MMIILLHIAEVPLVTDTYLNIKCILNSSERKELGSCRTFSSVDRI